VGLETTNLLFASGHQAGNLYHFGARYYDPGTATWTQQDPINQIASLTEANRYTYTGGNPVDEGDPTGTATAGGRCIEGRQGYMPAQCKRAGLKTVTAAEYAEATGTHVNDCAASVTGLVSSVIGGAASSPTVAGAAAGAAGAFSSLIGIAHSC
jgi:RHS repeat-associated protein